MEINFWVGRPWINCERPYEPVSNHKILKNVLIEAEKSNDRQNLMVDLLAQMKERLPPFSALYINLNPKIECPEIFTSKFTYSSSEFTIPYNLELGDYLYDTFNRCYTAILDFHPEMLVIMGIIHHKCKKKGFPTSFLGFLELMRTYIQENEYDGEFTSSLLKNIKEVRELFESDNTLEQTLRVGTRIPDWVTLWRKKQKIWIDLSKCEPHIQKMLIPVIFLALLRSTDDYGPAENYWRLNGVVILNDADKVFASVPWERYLACYNQRRYHWNTIQEHNWFLTKEQIIEAYGDTSFLFKSQLETYYHYILLDEFRFRNISLLTGTKDEKAIYDFISSLSQVRFVQGESNNFDI
jgi:hypothetical protein